MTTIFIGVYNHQHGTDVCAYTTEELAEEARRDIAAEYWDEVMEDEPRPTDRREMADAYFAATKEGPSDEDYEIVQCQLIGEFTTTDTTTTEESK